MGNRSTVEAAMADLGRSWQSGSKIARIEVARGPFPLAGIAPLIDKVAQDFAGTVDWMSGCCSHVDGGLRLSITENEPGLHEGGYVSLTAEPFGNSVRITGGCYDSFYRPVTVCEKSIPLNSLKERALGEVLMETHDKLTRYYRTHIS